MSNNRYTYRAEWSPEDDEYVGLVAEFPSLSWLAPTAGEAIAGAERLVDDILADMKETGEIPPVPLTERRYSGNISFRTSPDHHRRLAIEAAEQGVSINQWMMQRLSTLRDHQQAAASSLSDEIRKVIGREMERMQVEAKKAGRAVIQSRRVPANTMVSIEKGVRFNTSMPLGLAHKIGPFQERPADEFAMWVTDTESKRRRR